MGIVFYLLNRNEVAVNERRKKKQKIILFFSFLFHWFDGHVQRFPPTRRAAAGVSLLKMSSWLFFLLLFFYYFPRIFFLVYCSFKPDPPPPPPPAWLCNRILIDEQKKTVSFIYLFIYFLLRNKREICGGGPGLCRVAYSGTLVGISRAKNPSRSPISSSYWSVRLRQWYFFDSPATARLSSARAAVPQWTFQSFYVESFNYR